jgi:uncharacterized protein YkwD
LNRNKSIMSIILETIVTFLFIAGLILFLYIQFFEPPREVPDPTDPVEEQVEPEEFPEIDPVDDSIIGLSEAFVRQEFGNPIRTDDSEYDFSWQTFHSNYDRYILFGIDEGQVVAAYSHLIILEPGLDFEMTRQQVHDTFGEPLDFYPKADGLYATTTNPTDYEVFDQGKYYLTAFYDVQEDYRVTANMVVKKEKELAKPGFYGDVTPGILHAFELQNFDIVNAERRRRGLQVFQWDDRVAAVSRAHSEDMAVNEYFDHINLQGDGPYERLSRELPGIGTTSENLAAGGTAIHAHHGLMNSPGHRVNILRAGQTHMGVGAAYNPETIYILYFTQMFTELQ